MKKNALFFTLAVINILILLGFSSGSEARTNVDISVNIPLPSLVFAAPPAVVPVPSSHVYFVPDVEVDVLFYDGYWYRPHHGHWYRAHSYRGPWAGLSSARVPRAVIGLPRDYRHRAARFERIQHNDFDRNWKKWKREKHWEREARKREREERHGHDGHDGRGERGESRGRGNR